MPDPQTTAPSAENYRATVSVPATAEQARTALFDEMHVWWTTRAERMVQGVTVRFHNSHATFAFDADSPLIWHCTNAHMIINDYDPTEWTGTQLIWTITETSTGCDITLEHVGLNASLACRDVCTRGWQSFFETSLKAHLCGGTPAPETT